jgi:hypothetical protein
MLRRWVPSALLFVTAVGCVVRLTRADDEPLPNGDVSGPAADCSKPPAEGRGTVSGAPRVVITGRTLSLAASADAGAAEAGADGATTGVPADPEAAATFRYPLAKEPPVAFQWSGTGFSARFSGADEVVARIRLPIVYDRVKDQDCPQGVDLIPDVDETGKQKVDENGTPAQRRIECSPEKVPSNSVCCVPEPTVPIMVEVDGKATRRGLSRPIINAATGERRPTAGIDPFIVAEGLDPNVEHEIRVFRSIEADRGIFEFHGFTFNRTRKDGDKKSVVGPGTLLPPVERPRLIEVIGDSISVGYGVYGKNASCRYTIDTQENYDTYGAITARAFDADLINTSLSGRGVFRNNATQPQQVDAGGGRTELRQVAAPDNMRTMFERLLPGRTLSDAEELTAGTQNQYTARLMDFTSARQPQVVVINLGTNDFYLGPPDSAQFYDAYRSLVERVRSLYPKAHIFCTLPAMISDTQSDLPRTIMRDALKRLIADFGGRGDQRVYHMEFLDQGVRYGLGCDFHPNVTTHRIVAEQLIGAIRSKTCW